MAHGEGHYVYKAFLLKERKCEICNIDDIEVLCVHHIDNKKNNNDISNLQILCANCHFRIHFGKGKIKKKKLETILKYKERVDAFKEWFFKESYINQHQNRDEIRKETEPSSCNSDVQSRKTEEKEIGIQEESTKEILGSTFLDSFSQKKRRKKKNDFS